MPTSPQTLRLIALLPLWVAAWVMTGCAGATELDLAEKITIGMIGVFEAPPDAAGNAEPKFLGFTLRNVTLTKDDGTAVDLFEEEEPTEHRIIGRSQIIFEAELADHVDSTFTTLEVEFDPTVTGGGKIEDEMSATLANPKPQYVEIFKVEKAQSLRMDISVQWKNVITRDLEADPATETMTAPTLTLDLKNQ